MRQQQIITPALTHQLRNNNNNINFNFNNYYKTKNNIYSENIGKIIDHEATFKQTIIDLMLENCNSNKNLHACNFVLNTFKII